MTVTAAHPASAAPAARVRPAGPASAHETSDPVRLTSVSAERTASILAKRDVRAELVDRRLPRSDRVRGRPSRAATPRAHPLRPRVRAVEQLEQRPAAEEVEIAGVRVIVEESQAVSSAADPGAVQPIDAARVPSLGPHARGRVAAAHARARSRDPEMSAMGQISHAGETAARTNASQSSAAPTAETARRLLERRRWDRSCVAVCLAARSPAGDRHSARGSVTTLQSDSAVRSRT